MNVMNPLHLVQHCNTIVYFFLCAAADVVEKQASSDGPRDVSAPREAEFGSGLVISNSSGIACQHELDSGEFVILH